MASNNKFGIDKILELLNKIAALSILIEKIKEMIAKNKTEDVKETETSESDSTKTEQTKEAATDQPQ